MAGQGTPGQGRRGRAVPGAIQGGCGCTPAVSRKSPYADIKPAGTDAADGRGIVREAAGQAAGSGAGAVGRAPGKLWHSSPGAPGGSASRCPPDGCPPDGCRQRAVGFGFPCARIRAWEVRRRDEQITAEPPRAAPVRGRRRRGLPRPARRHGRLLRLGRAPQPAPPARSARDRRRLRQPRRRAVRHLRGARVRGPLRHADGAGSAHMPAGGRHHPGPPPLRPRQRGDHGGLPVDHGVRRAARPRRGVPGCARRSAGWADRPRSPS